MGSNRKGFPGWYCILRVIRIRNVGENLFRMLSAPFEERSFFIKQYCI